MSPTPQRVGVDQADDVAGVGDGRWSPARGRRPAGRTWWRTAGRCGCASRTMPRSKTPGADPDEGDPVAVGRVHAGLHLEDEAANGSSTGRGSPSASGRAAAAGARSTRTSSSRPTPKLSTAEPNSTGVVAPARNASSWSCAVSQQLDLVLRPAPASPRGPPRPRRRRGAPRGDGRAAGGAGEAASSPSARSSTPAKSPAMPTGQVSGVGVRPVRVVDLVHQLQGVQARAVPLVDHGDDREPRRRQTSNSFIVWASRPLAASTSMTAASTAASTR